MAFICRTYWNISGNKLLQNVKKRTKSKNRVNLHPIMPLSQVNLRKSPYSLFKATFHGRLTNNPLTITGDILEESYLIKTMVKNKKSSLKQNFSESHD